MSDPTHAGEAPPVIRRFNNLGELNDYCAIMAQSAAANLADPGRQNGGDFTGRMIMSQAIYQALCIQDMIDRYEKKQRHE